jgi:hypothetical protein
MIISSPSYALSAAVTTDNGRIVDIFVISGWKSIVSCLIGAHVLSLQHRLFVSVHQLLTIV